MSRQPEPTSLEILREMHAKSPRDGFVAYGLAMELAKKPATEDEAVRTFRRLVADVSDYLPAYLQFGMLLSRRGENEEARKVYEQGIALASRLGDQHTRQELDAALSML
jgi:Flp pilus assembly protein TadD